MRAVSHNERRTLAVHIKKPVSKLPEMTETDKEEPVRRDTTAGKPEAQPPETSGREVGGRTGPDPTRYGDWEKNGRCIDF